MSISESYVAAPIVTSWKLARESFGLARVRRLKDAKPFFTGNAIVEKEGGTIRHSDFGELTT